MKIPLDIEQKGNLREFHFETKSIFETQQQYQRHSAVRKASHRKTIWRIGERFLTERNVHNVNKERCSQTRGTRTQQNMEAVRLSAFQSRKKFLPTTLPRVGSEPDEDSP